MQARVGASKGLLPLAVVAAAGLALYAALFLATVQAGFIRQPYWDAYDILSVEFRAEDRGDPGLYLWTPHAGHHIVWLRLLTSADVRLFHGQSVIFALAALVALLLTAALLSRETWRGVEDKPCALALATVPPLALLTTLNAFDVAAPLNTPYVFAVLAAVAAFVVAERAPPSLATLVALLALAAAAPMGNSVGLAATPVLMLAVLRRPDRGRVAWLWLLGPVLVAVFAASAGPMALHGAGPVQPPLARLGHMARYFITFCGLPWSASTDKLALGGGLQAASGFAGPALGLLLAAAGIRLALRPVSGDAPRARLERICRDLILFSLAAAGMAALGRSQGGAEVQVPVRYSVILAPLHIGVLTLLALRVPAVRRIGRRALVGILAVVMALGAAHQLAGREVIVGYCTHLRQVLAAFDAGRRTPEMTRYVYPDLARAEQIGAEMKRRGVYQ